MKSFTKNKWVDQRLEDFIKTFTIQSKQNTRRRILGSGNLYNPKTSQECLQPITIHNFDEVPFYERIPLQELLVQHMKLLGQGTNNKAYSTALKTRHRNKSSICYSKQNQTPLVFRCSKQPLSLHPFQRKESLDEFLEEMELQAKLHGIMPELYMYGTFVNERTHKEHMFSIMYRGVDLHKLFHNQLESKISDVDHPQEYLLDMTYSVTELLGQHCCNLDIKPLNLIASNVLERFDQETQKTIYTITPSTKVFVIDVDPYYVYDLSRISSTNRSNLCVLIMKYLLSQHFEDKHTLLKLQADPQYNEFIDVYDSEMKKRSSVFKSVIEAYGIQNPQETRKKVTILRRRKRASTTKSTKHSTNKRTRRQMSSVSEMDDLE